MKSIALFFLFLLSQIVYSQVGSINEVISCHPCGSDLLVKGDIDADGITDLLIYSEIDQKMAWVKSDGRGHFVARTRLPDYKGIIDLIFLADLDGDGYEDVLFTSEAENTIGWFKNEGDGQFNTPAITISNEIDRARHGAIADVDNDGDIDFVTSSFREETTIIFENDGAGNFRIKQVIDEIRTTIIYLEDLNGDGAVDIYAVTKSGLAWFNNDGTGHFDTLTLIDDFTWEGFADFGDLDGDGDMDIITSEDRDDLFGWYENEGDGQFKEKKILGEIKGSGGAVQSIDIDLDGDLDVVTFQRGVRGDMLLVENDGLGNFSPATLFLKDIQWLNSFILEDLDKDGDLDIAAGAKFNERALWFEQTANGTYIEHQISFTEVLGLSTIQTVDLDKDGDEDILAVANTDGSLSWFANDGQGNFSEKKLITAKEAMRGAAYTADIDLDGDLDVFYADRDTVGWVENDGKGQFIKEHLIDDYSGANVFFATEDIDGDGDIDVVTTGYGHFGYIFFHINDGAGNFAERSPIFPGRNNGIIQLADLDGDGDKDLLMSAVFNGRVSWFENDPSISRWKEHFFPSAKSGWATVLPVDLDGDTDIDIAIASSIGVEWFENDGQGTFTLKQTFANEEETWKKIISTDLDQDGSIDLVLIEPKNHQVLWYRNDGTGYFTEGILMIPNLQGVDNVSMADIDGDGDDDFVTTSEFGKIAWFENLQDYPISINAFVSNNYNCTKEDHERGIRKAVQIRALPSQTEQIFYTNEAGILATKFGSTEQDTAIEVRLFDTPGRYFKCPTLTYPLNKLKTVSVDLPLHLENCPMLTVDIGTPLLRRCFDNIYTVSYCNYSREDIYDGSVSIQLDSFFTIVKSDLSYEGTGEDLYTFSLPTVTAGNCGEFRFTINLSCQATLGQTHCVEAHAYPDSICVEDQLVEWTGARLQIESSCEQGVAKFKVSNAGKGDMLQEQSLIVIEDATIIKERELRLGQGSTESVFLPGNGATYHAYINQVPNHPGRSTPIAYVEGCGGINTTGLVNTFPKDDQDLFKAIDCQENIGSYDPNDKAATPIGLESEHYLASNTDIKYKIRFQNTGTDTAFTVVIWDTLSRHLNASTIEAGASSHPYQFDRFQDTLTGLESIRFTFSDIMLPDSNINEPGSHGFVQFRLQQIADLPDGTIIENEAAIYFDFNEPIITNVVHHTIGFPLTRLVVNTIEKEIPKEVVSIVPNPFGEFITIERSTLATDIALLTIIDVAGREVVASPLYHTTQQIATTRLGKGLYFYRVVNEAGQVIGNGKIVKE